MFDYRANCFVRRINDLNISCFQCGNGEDVLFLHGYLSCKESFYYQLNYLSRYFRVTAFDNAGFGGSQTPQTPYSLSDYVKLTGCVIDELGLKRPHIISHSFGGRVAIKLACERGGLGRLAFCSAAGVIERRSLGYKLRVAAYKRAKRRGKSLDKYGSADYKALPEVMRQSFVKIVNESVVSLCPKIDNECLFVYGRADEQTPVRFGKIFVRQTPRAALAVCRGGHFFFCEQPSVTNKIAKSFFTGGLDALSRTEAEYKLITKQKAYK